MSVIRLKQVSKRFGSQVALRDVAFEVPPGIVFAMLGENGAGKTTCIGIVLGLDEPTSGLDTLVRREFLESMVDRAASGKTVFLSSHQIHEVERVADVVAILRRGELVVVERLERLKAQTQELTVTLRDPRTEPPQVLGELLRQRRRSRQWQLLVRNADAASLAQLQEDPAVQAVDARTPGLEEIFVAYMRQGAPERFEAADRATIAMGQS